jgi:hypothetical protein
MSVTARYDRVEEFDGLRVETFVTGRWHENCYVLTDLATFGRHTSILATMTPILSTWTPPS